MSSKYTYIALTVLTLLVLISCKSESKNKSSSTKIETTETKSTENPLEVLQNTTKGTESTTDTTEETKSTPIFAGSVKISELVKNKEQYEGKTVRISGTCTKINLGIMKKNWILIKDGSQDDYDLIITSDVVVEEASSITMDATVVLNKDFGAGYKYELILENGKLIE